MANFNLNTHIVPFFDSVKEPLTEAKISDSVWNNGYDNLSLEISGDGTATVTVQGCVNTVDAEGQQLPDSELQWTDLSMLSAKDYSQKPVLSENGIYYVGIIGISRIRINATEVSGNKIIVGAFSK